MTNVGPGTADENEEKSSEEPHQIPSPSPFHTPTGARDICQVTIKLHDNLSVKQRSEVLDLFKEFEVIFSHLPGQTELVECALHFTSDNSTHFQYLMSKGPITYIEANCLSRT